MKCRLISGVVGALAFASSFVVNVSAYAEDDNCNVLEIITHDYVSGNDTIENMNVESLEAENAIMFEELGITEEEADEAYEPVLSNSVSPLSIIPPDDDQQPVNPYQYPYSAVLCLRLGQDTNGDGITDSWGLGTGFLEGYDVMATAGHCFYNQTYGWVEECRIYVHQNSSTFGTTYYYPQSWACATEYTVNHDINYDWCAVTLQDNLGSSNGWFGKGCGGDMLNTEFTISGYPANTQYKVGRQYKASGFVNSSTDYRVSYSIDTEGGNSGSPIYDSNKIAWGIHTHSGNSGSRITPWLYEILQNKFLEGAERYGH